ncbi:uncharacterized protein UV8b_08007 [Ustilaginoidea virens]|uniref:VWFA domain-containing protein n=1 Tax=Ustilaginoidea virens TaxID=1159556 RepID=A0A8E5MLB9_USTVR|nr:uncharacterized protein UV8b_08007 [Ustilaginoidea virens]QUC23766.1 hypothetical protein UV8b_08007 [Ustilaginoidea virens]
MRIPLRNGAPAGQAGPGLAALQLHPVPSKQSLLVKVVPPRVPASHIEHVPCDIVLVVDVSTSMQDDAPVPGENESTGLSVLDVTKHAALTILETLNDKDRLGIVTFSTKSTIVQPLTYMDVDEKEQARSSIKRLEPNGSTNLWHGIQDGIRVFEEALDNANVRAMMILTDGMPNHMCPPQGYIPKLKTLRPLPATVHTFGFGYGLRSGLLKSLAEYGHGNYSFIPDAGMVGTVFVHAVANLQATFATGATLTLSYPPSAELDQVGEETVVKQHPRPIGPGDATHMEFQIPLGNLQFGQTRDVFLRVKDGEAPNLETAVVTATLCYQRAKIAGPSILGPPASVTARSRILEPSAISAAEVAYHESRAELCRFLSSMFPLGPDGEHRPDLGRIETFQRKLAKLMAEIPARDFDDEKNASLMLDVNGPEPQGQVSLAVNNAGFLQKWGVHYLPSYSNAHASQVCNSFKDPGPLQYGADSPLFISCRDRLNDAFDNLPPPEPLSRETYWHGHGHGHGHGHFGQQHQLQPVHMSRYRNAAGSCFAASTPVELASGRRVPIRRLRRGVKVRTPAGARKVAMVLETPVRGETLCRVGSLLVTPWHPVSLDGKAWGFPASLAERAVRYTGCVYSVMLERRGDGSQSHALRVAGAWGATLGHGLTTGNDARAHSFFGDYGRVRKSLVRVGVDELGVARGGGVDRDSGGRVCGFRR